jgi:hypothetical protein
LPEKKAGMEKPKRARRRKLDTAKVNLKPLRVSRRSASFMLYERWR